MDYCLLVFLLGLVVYILQQKTIEGLDVECATNFEDCEDDPETCIYTRVVGCDDEDATNYQTCVTDPDNDTCRYPLQEADLNILIQKGVCTNEGDLSHYASCEIPDLVVPNVELNVRYPNTTIDDSTEYMFSKVCPSHYSEQWNRIKEASSVGQYSGYTPNQYIDRIRFQTSEDPLPTNPDFFSSNGGTYA